MGLNLVQKTGNKNFQFFGNGRVNFFLRYISSFFNLEFNFTITERIKTSFFSPSVFNAKKEKYVFF